MTAIFTLLLQLVSVNHASISVEPVPDAMLLVKVGKESVSATENSILVSLVLKNTGTHPFLFARSWLGGQYDVDYVPEPTDIAHKRHTWSRGILRGTPCSRQPPEYNPATYTAIMPGQDYRAEVDVGPFLRSLTPEGLMPGTYLLTFWYAYEPDGAEQDLPLLERVSALAPVKITVNPK